MRFIVISYKLFHLFWFNGLILNQRVTFNCDKFPAVSGDKAQSWFQRQLPDEMSQDYDPQESQYAAAVAAAAFSIYSVEEAEAQNRRNMRKEIEMSRAKLKSIKEDSISRQPSIRLTKIEEKLLLEV